MVAAGEEVSVELLAELSDRSVASFLVLRSLEFGLKFVEVFNCQLGPVGLDGHSSLLSADSF